MKILHESLRLEDDTLFGGGGKKQPKNQQKRNKNHPYPQNQGMSNAQ